MKKIFLVVNDLVTATNFRKDLMKTLHNLGHDVAVISPSQSNFVNSSEVLNDSQKLSFRHIHIFINRVSLNPFASLKYILFLSKILKSERPDYVLLYTPKIVIFGSIASRIAGVHKVYSTINGLGYAFASQSFKAKFLSVLLKALYKVALSFNAKVFFQNSDDRNYFLTNNLVDNNKSLLINGSGVNINEFQPRAKLDQRYIFLMIARIIPEKGVYEFLQAARMVKQKYPNIVFQLLGPLESESPAILPKTVSDWNKEGAIEYISQKSDVKPYIANCNTFVLPSYREGTPKSVLEAMAMGKPIITSDVPGCREPVIDGVNGYLVPPRNSHLLGESMLAIYEDEDFAKLAGVKSIEIIKDKYDVIKVNKFFMQALEIASKKNV
ncbi:MAG: glycosyltransferase family 1 protein [Woeseia sp.]|nr:glycosyltransferase family 1 protein [Woeseia sp.]|tara:strand:- start:878 stop:2023 length:1146 start_codon:yes stop_codon:yes gene_type:complete